MKKKKIGILITNLKGGGAEKLVVDLANNWINSYHVDILLINKTGEFLSSVNDNIDIIDLKSRNIRNAIIPLRKRLKENDYDVLWANMYPLTIIAAIASLFISVDLFFTDHNNLNNSLSKKQMKIASFLINIFYRSSRGNSLVSKGLITELTKLSKLNRSYFKSIYNPSAVGHEPTIITDKEITQLWGKESCLKLLAVGKLKEVKNHMMLLKAINALKEKNIRLIIVGEGELKGQLQEYIDNNNINHIVELFGFSKDVNPFYNSADIFVHTSLSEGFGNVIVEALEFGLPVITTDCPHGPREILDNGKYGTLIGLNNHIELSEQIMHHQKNLSHFKKKSYVQRQILRSKFFGIEKISNEYLEWFKL